MKRPCSTKYALLDTGSIARLTVNLSVMGSLDRAAIVKSELSTNCHQVLVPESATSNPPSITATDCGFPMR